MSLIYQGPSPIAKKIDKVFGVVLLVAAILILCSIPFKKNVAQEENGATETAQAGSGVQENRVFHMGQEVMVFPDTVAYESSKEAGFGAEWKLNETKVYRINGYSYISESGEIGKHDYKKHEELTKSGGKIEIEEPQEEGKTLMLHLYIIEGEMVMDKGWVRSKNVIQK